MTETSPLLARLPPGEGLLDFDILQFLFSGKAS
jgi:hypothetical protein